MASIAVRGMVAGSCREGAPGAALAAAGEGALPEDRGDLAASALVYSERG